MALTDPHPRIGCSETPEGPCALLHGRWGAAELGQRVLWLPLAEQLAKVPHQPALGWDLRGMLWLDHVGAQVLWNHWGRAWPARLWLSDAQRDMLERVARYTVPAPAPEPWRLADQVDHLGVLVLHGVDHARHLLQMVGQMLLDTGRLLRAPRRAPWRDVSGHLYRMGATALPITALVGFLIGVVMSYLSALQLKMFGADIFIVNILGISIIRELGPVLVAVLVAGRSGSAMTAQIGVMRVTEEIDALATMGISRTQRLVLPKIAALTTALPLLVLWTSAAGILGGMVSANLQLGLSYGFFLDQLPKAVPLANLWIGLAKGWVFGLLISLVACHFGLHVKPNTESLSARTTAAVVTAITIVILVDALFAIATREIGLPK